MQMALPFERLDARALSYARKTRLENLEKIIAEIEEENARLEMEKQVRRAIKSLQLRRDNMKIKDVVGECLVKMGQTDFSNEQTLDEQQTELKTSCSLR